MLSTLWKLQSRWNNSLKRMAFMKEAIITLTKTIAYTAGYKLQQFKKNYFWLCSDYAKHDLWGNIAYLLQFVYYIGMIYLKMCVTWHLQYSWMKLWGRKINCTVYTSVSCVKESLAKCANIKITKRQWVFLSHWFQSLSSLAVLCLQWRPLLLI